MSLNPRDVVVVDGATPKGQASSKFPISKTTSESLAKGLSRRHVITNVETSSRFSARANSTISSLDPLLDSEITASPGLTRPRSP